MRLTLILEIAWPASMSLERVLQGIVPFMGCDNMIIKMLRCRGVVFPLKRKFVLKTSCQLANVGIVIVLKEEKRRDLA